MQLNKFHILILVNLFLANDIYASEPVKLEFDASSSSSGHSQVVVETDEFVDFSGKELVGHYYERLTPEEEIDPGKIPFATVSTVLRSRTRVSFKIKESANALTKYPIIRGVLIEERPDQGRSKWNEFQNRLVLTPLKDIKVRAALYREVVEKFTSTNPLKFIRFRDCAMIDDQLIELSLMITKMRELSLLDLGYNKLTKKSLPNLLSIVEHHPQLQYIYMLREMRLQRKKWPSF